MQAHAGTCIVLDGTAGDGCSIALATLCMSTLAVEALAIQVVSFTAQVAISLISEPGKESDFGSAFADKGWEPCV